jgi:glycosyltransferase involved in cell wall biosynthesis
LLPLLSKFFDHSIAVDQSHLTPRVSGFFRHKRLLGLMQARKASMLYFPLMETEAGTSIIIPCRNESGNLIPLIEAIIKIIKPNDEVIIIEGGSSDLTYEEALGLEMRFPRIVRTYKQTGKGKFDAVLLGIKKINMPIVMIWDADATVNFDQNHEIYLRPHGEAQLITGDRLRGKRDKGAMRFPNFLGNWAFAFLWSLILKQRPIDLLCGTKKFPRSLILEAPKWLLELDPYGDFSIFIMAKHLGVEIISIPVHYHSRSYGKTNIHRWRGGVELLSITLMIVFRFSMTKRKEK